MSDQKEVGAILRTFATLRPSAMKFAVRSSRRLLQIVPVVLGIAIINFCLLHIAPGDIVTVLAGEAGSGNAEYLETLRRRYGLDQPLYVQLGLYLTKLVQFNLGFSFRHNMNVSALILERLPATLMLMLSTILLSLILGVFFGVTAAKNVNRPIDRIISSAVLLLYAMPLFWLGLMFIVLFSVKLGVLPTGGLESIPAPLTIWGRVFDIVRHLTLPTLTLSLYYMAIYARVMRASMLEVYGQDFVRTAKAKGLSDSKIAFKHVLRNALLPLVSMVGVQMGSLLGGSVIVETVFSWPGLGRAAFDAVFQRDFNLLMGILLLCSLLVIVANLIVDILYSVLDPRIERR